MEVRDGKNRKGISCYCFLEQKNGKYLFAQRNLTSYWNPGKWDLPGGKMKFGETPEQTAKREVKEETNQTIKGIKLFDTFSVHVKKPNKNLHTIRIIFYGKAKGTAKKNHENAQLKLLTLKEAQRLTLVPKMKKEIKKFKRFVEKSR